MISMSLPPPDPRINSIRTMSCQWCSNPNCMSGRCICEYDCTQAGCPVALTDEYVPPPVPVFRRDDAA